MTFARRATREATRLIVRWFCVLLLAFGLLSFLGPAVRNDGANRGRDREAEKRSLARWAFDLPTFVNLSPKDAVVRCREAWENIEKSLDVAKLAGVSNETSVALLAGEDAEMPSSSPEANSAAGLARERLVTARGDYVLLVRHGSLARHALEVNGQIEHAATSLGLVMDRLTRGWAARGSRVVSLAPQPTSIVTSARSALAALSVGREPPEESATWAPWALEELVEGLSQVPDAHFDSAMGWVVSHTALPDPRSTNNNSRSTTESELQSTWRRRSFALVPSTTLTRLVAVVTETRWANWCSDALRGDFGPSLAVDPSSSAMALVIRRLPTTLVTCGGALIIAAAFGGLIGLRRSQFKAGGSWWLISLACLPEAWIGTLVLVMMTRLMPEASGVGLLTFLGAIVTLAIPASSVFARQTESAARVARRAPWIEAARARGTPESAITRRHVWPHTRPVVLALLAISLPTVVTGSVVVETLFGLDGVGALLADAAMRGDFPVGLAAITLSALVMLLAHAVVGVVEPSTREATP